LCDASPPALLCYIFLCDVFVSHGVCLWGLRCFLQLVTFLCCLVTRQNHCDHCYRDL
jgi:hypothetical protein